MTADTGTASVEAAISLAALVIVVALCLAALWAAAMNIRCVDAAREAARLAARGDEAKARSTAQQVAPHGADITIRPDGEHVVVRVVARAPMFPMLRVRADAVAVLEPGDD